MVSPIQERFETISFMDMAYSQWFKDTESLGRGNIQFFRRIIDFLIIFNYKYGLVKTCLFKITGGL